MSDSLHIVCPHCQSVNRVPAGKLADQPNHPEDLPVVLAKVRAYQETPSERLECEYRVRHQSGVWIWVLDRGRWLGDAGRQLIVGTLLNISSRKEMEQQLLRMVITDPFASRLRKHVRATDMAARIGGRNSLCCWKRYR